MGQYKLIKYMSYAVLDTSLNQDRFECGPNLNSFPFVFEFLVFPYMCLMFVYKSITCSGSGNTWVVFTLGRFGLMTRNSGAVFPVTVVHMKKCDRCHPNHGTQQTSRPRLLKRWVFVWFQVNNYVSDIIWTLMSPKQLDWVCWVWTKDM